MSSLKPIIVNPYPLRDLTVVIETPRSWTLRMRAALWLMSLASWVLGSKLSVEEPSSMDVGNDIPGGGAA